MLTNDQVTIIENFCESKGVKYYDVRQELVDHMSEWIEHDQENNHHSFEISFEKIQAVFTKQDFRAMVQSKARAVTAMVSRNYLHAFLDFFSWPKIFITAALVLVTILINKFADISKFQSAGIYFFNIINLSFSFGRGEIIYHNRVDKIEKLVSTRQINRLQLLFMSPTLIYLLFSILYLEGIILPVEMSRFALFVFPILILLTMAWRSASIDANEKIRHDYPDAFRLR